MKPSPLANELFQEKQDSILADTFPLNVKMCTVCHSYQLDCIVKADRLFSSYSYSSGLSSSLLKSFEATLQELQHHLSDGKGVIEIGSNDGSLLGLIKKAGIQAVGVEPSLRHVNETLNRGMSVVHGYCDSVGLSRARELLGLEVGAVVGNNVFAHIDDLIGSFKQISSILADQGYLIFEVSYFPDVVRLGLFDTIYHEHMSYHTVNSLKRLLEMAGMMLVKITHITTHGGSIRVVAQKGQTQESLEVEKWLAIENFQGYKSPVPLTELQNLILKMAESSKKFLQDKVDEGWILVGYGAPAKTVTFLSEFEVEKLPWDSIIDDNPAKQNKFLPRSGIPIKSTKSWAAELIEGSKILFVIFPWNLQADIENKIQNMEIPHAAVLKSVILFPKIVERSYATLSK